MMLKLIFSSLVVFVFSLSGAESEALTRLIKGNRQFVEGLRSHPGEIVERRQSLTQHQNPFATILGCSDSRVSPEIIFDQGIGDLFVVRIAGNVAGATELDSINYAVSVLNTSLIVVLGHENCGALQAMLDKKGDQIPALAPLLQPALDFSTNFSGNRLENVIKTNVKLMVKKIQLFPSFSKLIQEGRLQVVGGYYHLASGEVEFLF